MRRPEDLTFFSTVTHWYKKIDNQLILFIYWSKKDF